jgi:hypothetical protein
MPDKRRESQLEPRASRTTSGFHLLSEAAIYEGVYVGDHMVWRSIDGWLIPIRDPSEGRHAGPAQKGLF